MINKKQIGIVLHFFSKISVAVVKLTDNIKVGDKISFESEEKKVEQVVDSMQIDNKQIEEAGTGQEIAIKVNESVRTGIKVFKIEE